MDLLTIGVSLVTGKVDDAEPPYIALPLSGAIEKVGKPDSRYFMGVFNKTIIPLALVGYEMISANEALRASLATTTKYPTRTRGLIIK